MMKKIVRIVCLQILLLISLCICSTIVMKIFDLIFKFDNIWYMGSIVGILAWCILLIGYLFKKTK